jgi:hypothetical protein
MSNKIITDYTAVSTPANTDTLLCMQSGVTKKLTALQILSLVNSDNVSLADLEWTDDSNAWTYASVDSTYSTYTGIISINADVTSILSVGQKIKYVQDSTTKYAIIVAIGTYSGSATQITIFCGTSYLLTSSTITSPKYAMCYRPTDFPWQDPSIWSIQLSYVSDVSYSVSVEEGYNYPIANICLGVGKWDISYNGIFKVIHSGSVSYATGMVIGLDPAASPSETTTSNKITGCDFATYTGLARYIVPPNIGTSGTNVSFVDLQIRDTISLSAITKFWAACQRKTSSLGNFSIYIYGSTTPVWIKALCAYL